MNSANSVEIKPIIEGIKAINSKCMQVIYHSVLGKYHEDDGNYDAEKLSQAIAKLNIQKIRDLVLHASNENSYPQLLQGTKYKNYVSWSEVPAAKSQQENILFPTNIFIKTDAYDGDAYYGNDDIAAYCTHDFDYAQQYSQVCITDKFTGNPSKERKKIMLLLLQLIVKCREEHPDPDNDLNKKNELIPLPKDNFTQDGKGVWPPLTKKKWPLANIILFNSFILLVSVTLISLLGLGLASGAIALPAWGMALMLTAIILLAVAVALKIPRYSDVTIPDKNNRLTNRYGVIQKSKTNAEIYSAYNKKLTQDDSANPYYFYNIKLGSPDLKFLTLTLTTSNEKELNYKYDTLAVDRKNNNLFVLYRNGKKQAVGEIINDNKVMLLVSHNGKTIPVTLYDQNVKMIIRQVSIAKKAPLQDNENDEISSLQENKHDNTSITPSSELTNEIKDENDSLDTIYTFKTGSEWNEEEFIEQGLKAAIAHINKDDETRFSHLNENDVEKAVVDALEELHNNRKPYGQEIDEQEITYWHIRDDIVDAAKNQLQGIKPSSQ